MPGISGILAPHWSDRESSLLANMHRGMSRESFDVTDSLVLSSAGLGVAWVQHQGSFADCLPVWNETKDICLVFSGENFADDSLIDGLRVRGHSFRPGCADYLVHLYEEAGRTFVNQLNGTFCGVIVDLRTNEAILFNDRYGLSRLYCHQAEGRLYFASEAKALLKTLPQLRSIDPQSLGEWISCGCVLQNRSLFRGISLVPGGSIWSRLPDRPLQHSHYFQISTWENQPPLEPAVYYEQLHALFPRILRRYLRASQPIAMSLTGGLDGRLIMAWTGAQPGALPCYTFNGPYHDCADFRLAKRIAKACGQPHHAIPIEAAFFREFPELAAKTVRISDGAMDVTGAVELHANVRARTIAPIRLTGNYGSEIIRANVAFGPEKRLQLPVFAPETGRLISQAEQTYAAERKGSRLSFIASKQVPWHHHSRLSVEQSQLTMRSPFLDTELVGLVFRAPEFMLGAGEPSFRIISSGNAALARIPTDRGITYPPVPFLTPLRRRYADFMMRVEYAFDYGMPQSFASTVGRFLPRWGERLFLGNQKFYHFKTWYRHELAPFVQEVILDRRTLSRPWYDAKMLRQMVRDHLAGSKNYTTEIHKILSLELLERQLTD